MSSNDSLVNDSGTDNKATGEIDLHVDSKKSLKSKMSGGVADVLVDVLADVPPVRAAKKEVGTVMGWWS